VKTSESTSLLALNLEKAALNESVDRSEYTSMCMALVPIQMNKLAYVLTFVGFLRFPRLIRKGLVKSMPVELKDGDGCVLTKGI